MADSLPGLNRAVLRWARERAGLSTKALAVAMKQAPSVIEQWEEGTAAPTYAQLDDLAYRVLKRPLALFFFPEPPEETEPEQWFRTLPETEIEDLLPDTRYRMRDARSQQLALRDLTGGRNPSERNILRELVVTASARDSAAAVRNYLGVTTEVQTSEWRSTEDALRDWRARIEAAGVFVFKQTFKQKDVSGFSLFDDEFPLIVINNSTAHSRQIFTLLHELAHLLVKVGGVTKRDDAFIDLLQGERRSIEVFCNRLAGYALIPPGIVERLVRNVDISDAVVSDAARQLRVSREAILRRLLDLHLVSQDHYEKKAKAWSDDYLARKLKKPGGDYYRTQASYISPRFAELAFATFYRGEISVQQLADYLNVKAKSVSGIEDLVLQKAAG